MELHKPVAGLPAPGSQCKSSEFLLYVIENLLIGRLELIWQMGGAELKAPKWQLICFIFIFPFLFTLSCHELYQQLKAKGLIGLFTGI